MKIKLSAHTIYWATVYTAMSNNKALHRKLRGRNYCGLKSLLPWYSSLKDKRTVNLEDSELQELLASLRRGAQNSYIEHSDACLEALREICESLTIF